MTIGIVAPDAVLLVVGGTGAIGIEIAAQAAEGGARVIVHGSREESCAKAIETLAARFGPDKPRLEAAIERAVIPWHASVRSLEP